MSSVNIYSDVSMELKENRSEACLPERRRLLATPMSISSIALGKTYEAPELLRKRCWVDRGEPERRLVDAIKLGDEVFEVNVMVGVVVKHQFLKIPDIKSVPRE